MNCRVFGVIPAHNRRATTLKCLRALEEDGLLRWLSVIVVDDGSTDGTANAIRAQFPSVVVLRGNGDLWWTGAMRLGMQTAMAAGAEFIVWLNDDTRPATGTVERLVRLSAERNAVTGGVTYLPGESVPAYGGLRRTAWSVARRPGTGQGIEPVDALHGNLVCIPVEVVRTLGLPDAIALPHALADLDYTLRARQAGFAVLLDWRAPAVGEANLSLGYRSWLLSEVPISTWWRELARRGSHLNARAQWHFHWRHWGILGGLHFFALLGRLALISALRLVVPRHILVSWRGGKSANWLHEKRHEPPP